MRDDIAAYFHGKPPIFAQHYWHRPSSREYGDPEPEPICEAVGHALSQWGLADQSFANLFVTLTDTDPLKDRYVVNRAYYSIQRHRDRRRAIRAAADAYFSQYGVRKVVGRFASDTFDEAYASYNRTRNVARQSVTEILDAIELAIARHDDIAHGVIWKNVRLYDLDFGSFLMPSEYQTGYGIAGQPDHLSPWGFAQARYRYTGADITSFAAKFAELRDRVLDGVRKIEQAHEAFLRYQRALPHRAI